MPRRPDWYPPKTCKGCSGTFTPTHGSQVFCGPECRAYKPKRDPKPCGHCQTEFVPSHANAGYCSDACRAVAWRPPRKEPGVWVCVECGGEIRAARERRFCSASCSSAFMRTYMREKQRAEAAPRFCGRCGERYRTRGRIAFCASCWAEEKAARDAAKRRLRELRAVAVLVTVSLWKPCPVCRKSFAPSRDRGQRFCSQACWGESRRVPPRVCTSCGDEWRPTEKPESRAATRCWDCRRPKGDTAKYKNLRESLRKRLILREAGKCQDCGKGAEEVGEPLHAHHVEPQALGGENTLENLRLLCPDCHVGSGWWRNHYMLALSGLVIPPLHAVAA